MSALAVTSAPAPAIFISYAADDPQWPAADVEALAQRLKQAGATVHLDQWAERDRGRFGSDDEWRRWMREHLDLANHVLCLCSEMYSRLSERTPDAPPVGRGVAFESAQLEQWLYDRKQNNSGRIWLFQPDGVAAPRYLLGICPVYLAPHQQAKLINHLCQPDTASRQDALARRMRALIEEECVDLYVTLSGRREQDRITRLRVPQSTRRHIEADPAMLRDQVATEHADLLDVVQPDTRALLLGEPGAGKTLALLKVLQADLDAGREPLWIKLNHWLDGAMPFEQFVAQQVPDLGADWQARAAGGRCRLLIDGLNELPAAHAAAQTEGLAVWLQAHPACPLLISCRDTDLPPKTFDFIRERLTIRPLRATQIRRFVHNYLAANGLPDEASADAVFWPLLGGEQVAATWAVRPANTPAAVLDDLAEGQVGRASWLGDEQRELLAAVLADAARPYTLATNPYLLALLLWVWLEDEAGRKSATVPRHRVEVFGRYAGARLRGELEKTHDTLLDAEAVQDALSALAARLQQVAERTDKALDAGVLALPWADVNAADHAALHIAVGARLLRREGELVRFRHQLLQEFYVARYLRGRLAAGGAALLEGVWPGQQPLWQRAGWVQPFLLLAEYQHTDVPALLRTLADIQPEVAGAVWAQTRRLNPALLTDALAAELSARLTAQMLPKQPSAEYPLREAAFGRGLGLMRLADGRPLDRRPGVWGWYDAARHRAEVDIDWVRIPAGRFIYQGQPALIERDFLIGRHPVTHSQFQAFVDDPAGWADPQWWRAAPADERVSAWQPIWRYANHPCTEVSWYAAQAFCRWLAANRGEAIALPSERQWERAAAGTEGTDHPWAGEWSELKANAESKIGKTSFCGLFPQGCSLEGVHDLAGNVWEWTEDRYAAEGSGWWSALKAAVWGRFDPGALRAVRGGSWSFHAVGCRAGFRDRNAPDVRSGDLGFRVVCCPIPGP